MPYAFDYVTDAAIEGAIISRVSPSATAPNRGDADDYWYGGFSTPSATGINVTAESAMRLSAVYRCIRFLSSTIGKLPLKIYKKDTKGGRTEATDHPLSELLTKKPNSWQTRMDFFSMMQAHVSLRGNGIAQIVPGPSGAIDQLIPIHPDRVTINRLENGRLGYTISQPGGGAPKKFTQDEIFHIRGLSLDGIRGLNPIEYARETIGVGLAGEQFAARFFANDMTPGGILMHPATLKENARDNLKRSLREATGGFRNSHGLLLVEEGMTYTQMGIKGRDAQFLESRKFSVTDICRIFGVAPHIAYDLDRSTNNNIEHQGMEVVIYTLTELMEAIEQSIQRDLIDPLAPIYGDGYYAEFNADGLLRGDYKTRMEGYAIQIQNHLACPDECRSHENMNPIPDGTGAEFYHAVNIESDSQTADKAAALAATKPAPGMSPQPVQAPATPADEKDASLVTIRVKRELALALNGNAHWEQAA